MRVVASADELDESVASASRQAESAFGRFDAIRTRFVSVPGSVGSVELRAQYPGRPSSAPMLDLLPGRSPRTAAAINDSIASKLAFRGRMLLQ